nr:hypothetical protein [Tanacetum cinerariifolium]
MYMYIYINKAKSEASGGAGGVAVVWGWDDDGVDGDVMMKVGMAAVWVRWCCEDDDGCDGGEGGTVADEDGGSGGCGDSGGAWCGGSNRSDGGDCFWSWPEDSPENFSGGGGWPEMVVAGG